MSSQFGLAGSIPSTGGADFYTHQIPNSVRMVAPSSTSSSNARLTKTFSTVDSNVHWTLNFWIKRSAIEGKNPVSSARPLTVFTPRSSTSGSVLHEFQFGASGSYGAGDAFAITNTNSGTYILSTNNLFRDTSAWYNIHIQADLDNGTASEKLKIFINGTEADYNVDNRSSYSSMAGIVAGAWTIGDYYNYGYPIQSYLAQWAYVDGSTLAHSVFIEEKNGVTIPKDLSSGITWGNAGHLLMFQDSSNFGDDTSGEGNDWASSNLSTHDQMTDTCTFNSSSNGGNFPTYNPLLKKPTGVALSEGNLRASLTSDDCGIMSNWAVPLTGKWYWEIYIEAIATDHGIYIGVMPLNTDLSINQEQNDLGLVYYSINGNSILKGTRSSYGATWTTGDIISIAVDRDADTLQFYKNGAGQGTISISSLDEEFFYYIGYTGGSGACTGIVNFGQDDGTFCGNVTAGGNSDDTGYGNYKYSVPSGFLSLNTGNLSIQSEIDPASSDDYPQKLFGAYTYVGNNDGDRTVSTDFQADMVWIKVRSIVDNNYIQDSTRGFGFSKSISTNSTGAQGANGGSPSSTKVTSVSSSNMIVTGADFTYSSATYVAWLWRANGGTTSTNSNGSTNSTVQVDPSGNFSIVKFEGQNDSWGNPETIGHGLSSAPTCMILKNYDKTDEWSVFFSDYGDYSIGGSNPASNSLVLNSTDALYTNQSYKGWGGVMPTSTVFTVDGNNNNGSGESIVVYCFSNCDWIKSGAYEGNGDGTNGKFVYTGFSTSFVLVKKLTANNWRVEDDARDPYNPRYHMLLPNSTAGEDAYTDGTDYTDFLSNGFRVSVGGDSVNWNASGATYVYLAFAKNPLKYSVAQ